MRFLCDAVLWLPASRRKDATLHEEYQPIMPRRASPARKPLIAGELSIARLLREQLQPVEETAVCPHLVVQVIAGGAAGRADVADDVAALDLCALLDRVLQQVAVARFEPEAVID